MRKLSDCNIFFLGTKIINHHKVQLHKGRATQNLWQALCFLRESTVGSVTILCQVEATESLCFDVMGHSGQRSYADRCLSQGNAIDGTDKVVGR